MCKPVTETVLSRYRNKNTVSHMTCWDWSCQDVNMGHRPQVRPLCFYHIASFDWASPPNSYYQWKTMTLEGFFICLHNDESLWFLKACCCLFFDSDIIRIRIRILYESLSGVWHWRSSECPGARTQRCATKLFSPCLCCCTEFQMNRYALKPTLFLWAR